MENAIATLIDQFKAHAGNDGSASTLSKNELQSLVASQLSNYVPNANDSATIDQLMSTLDENSDGELTFAEFWRLIGNVAANQAGL